MGRIIGIKEKSLLEMKRMAKDIEEFRKRLQTRDPKGHTGTGHGDEFRISWFMFLGGICKCEWIFLGDLFCLP